MYCLRLSTVLDGPIFGSVLFGDSDWLSNSTDRHVRYVCLFLFLFQFLFHISDNGFVKR